MRELVAESHLRVDDLIAPLFVREGIDEPQPIVSLPGVVQHTRSSLRAEVDRTRRPRRAVGHPLRCPRDARTPSGAARTTPTVSCRSSLRDLRADLGDDIVVMADLCVDEYTDHGHCGIVDEHGVVDNDATLQHLCPGRRRPGARRSARRRAERDDGRTGGGDPHARSMPTVTTTWRSSPTPRSTPSALYGPFRDAVDVTIVGRRRPQGLPAGLAQPREARREIDARHRRGCRHGDGQAGAGLPRRDRRRRRARRRARSRRTTSAASTR